MDRNELTLSLLRDMIRGHMSNGNMPGPHMVQEWHHHCDRLADAIIAVFPEEDRTVRTTGGMD